MALKKRCNVSDCSNLVEYGVKYCSIHIQTEQQRHRIYGHRRNDKAEQKFYSSKEWLTTRDDVKRKCLGICLYSYYIKNELVYTDYIHHIETLKDNWNRRTDKANLIPVCASVHQMIHKQYDKSDRDKKDMQMLLYSLLDRFNREFGKVLFRAWVGDSKKVFT